MVVARDGIPAPTGHDRTAMVVFQRADEPGSLISILQEFAARRINLSNLLSRPTKAGGLGDYCFVIYAEAHVDDELMADTLRALHAKQGAVKFLGSYPAAGEHASDAREHADARWRSADDWVAALASHPASLADVGTGPGRTYCAGHERASLRANELARWSRRRVAATADWCPDASGGRSRAT